MTEPSITIVERPAEQVARCLRFLWRDFHRRAAQVSERSPLYRLPYPVSWLMDQLTVLMEDPGSCPDALRWFIAPTAKEHDRQRPDTSFALVPRVTWERHCRLRRAAFAHHGKAEMTEDATESYREMLEAIWALAQDDRVEEWISVEDELPEPDAPVLVIFEPAPGGDGALAPHERERRAIAAFCAKRASRGLFCCWYRCQIGPLEVLHVTHWMPLPELP